jgi:hypothetical protein
VQVRVQHLDRHRAAKLRVEAPPDHGHASLADLLLEAIPAEEGGRHGFILARSGAGGIAAAAAADPAEEHPEHLHRVVG